MCAFLKPVVLSVFSSLNFYGKFVISHFLPKKALEKVLGPGIFEWDYILNLCVSVSQN